MTDNAENQAALAAKILAARKNFKPIKFDAKNPHFGNKYATLGALMAAVQDALADQGVLVTHDIKGDDPAVVFVRCIITDGRASLDSGFMPICATRRIKEGQEKVEVVDAQTGGSATTYGKRYTLAAVLGLVADEDDDGNAASAPKDKPNPKPEPPKYPSGDELVEFAKAHGFYPDRLVKALEKLDSSAATVHDLSNENRGKLMATMKKTAEKEAIK